MENNTVQENIEYLNNSFKKYPREQQKHSKEFYNNTPKQKPVVLNQPQKQCH